MVRIHLPDGREGLLVPPDESRCLRVRRLVQRVVAGDPGVALESAGELTPEVDRPVLELAILPEESAVDTCIGVPVDVLRWSRASASQRACD